MKEITAHWIQVCLETQSYGSRQSSFSRDDMIRASRKASANPASSLKPNGAYPGEAAATSPKRLVIMMG
jgi:hypothetical protein